MAFSLSGTTITQTGTDTSLAGLSGLAGVTTSTFFGVVTVYNIGNNRLVINGTLSFNAELQALQIGTGAAFPNIEVSGVFNIGTLQSKAYNTTQNPQGGSFTRVQRRPAVMCSRVSPTTYLPTEASLQVNSGGVCRMYGTTLLHGGTINCVSGSTFESFDGMLYCIASRHRWFNSPIGGTRLYVGGDDATDGGVINLLGSSGSYIGVEPDMVGLVYSQNSTLRNYVSGRTVFIDHRVDSGALTTSINPLYGSRCSFNVNENSTTNSAANTGGLLVKRELNVEVIDSAGTPVQNCKVFVPYTNDGNRRDGLGQTITTLTAESGLTNASGTLSLQVLLAAWIRTTAGVAGVANQGLNAPTYLNKNGDSTDDLFDIRFITYDHLVSENTNVSLRGQNALQVERVILADLSITQATKATVDAYTTLETSAKFYDRAKSWLVDNYTGQSAALVSRSGSLIDAGSYNVVIDATAAQAFALSGNTITIKASIYTGDMTTTGIITLANGAQFNGTRTDANGTIAPPTLQSVTITNGVAGTLLLIQDVTNPSSPVTLYLGTPSSWPHTWTDSSDYVADRDIRIRAAYQSGTSAKLFVDEEIGTSTYASPALSYRLNQQDDTVYSTNAVDGSTVTGITINDTALLIETTIGSIDWGDIYAYEVYWLATEDGIIDEGRIITAIDAANYIFEGPWKIKNVSSPSAPLVISGGWGRSKSDNTTQSMIDTTGGTIFAAPDQVYATIVSTSDAVITGDIADIPAAVQTGMTAQGYTAARANSIDSMQASIDALNDFNPATDVVSANVKYVNNIEVKGTGTDVDPWNPV